uniref:Uncharacterized protein n=1 Tax=Magallana gigas TaxID=29159 RepID=K1Q7H6_MAGGI
MHCQTEYSYTIYAVSFPTAAESRGILAVDKRVALPEIPRSFDKPKNNFAIKERQSTFALQKLTPSVTGV